MKKMTSLLLLVAITLVSSSFKPMAEGNYYYAYTATFCKLSKDEKEKKYCFISEVFFKEKEYEAQKLRTKLQNDIKINYPGISPLPTQIILSKGCKTKSEADEERSKTAAYFTNNESRIIMWVQ